MPMIASYPWLALEARRDPSREWITWAVRMKLDLCGIRIGLEQWKALTDSERDRLHDFPVENLSDAESFKALLLSCLQKPGAEFEAVADRESAQRCWNMLGGRSLPASVEALADKWSLDLNWDRLNFFGRYVFSAIAEKRDPESYKEDIKILLSSREFLLLTV